ncbi:hypothetical protein J3A83DRAFT_4375259 [Scleroderma citrinum]
MSDVIKLLCEDLGHTNNLAHPTLASLVIDFFYTGANAMENLFPEVFENEVPHAAIAFTATAIKVALDEVVAEGKDVPFKWDVYADVIEKVGLVSESASTTLLSFTISAPTYKPTTLNTITPMPDLNWRQAKTPDLKSDIEDSDDVAAVKAKEHY